MTIYAPVLNHIWAAIESYGIDAKQLFEEAGIDPRLRLDSNARVDDQQLDQLFWIAKQQSRDDAFVFHILKYIQPSYMGAFGLAWSTSASLRDAYERLARYGRMIGDELGIRVEDHNDEVWVELIISSTEYRDPALRERGRLAILVYLSCLVYGEAFSPCKVIFQQPQPSNIQTYYEYFRCELVFDSEKSAIAIPKSIADAPLPGFNPQIVQQLDQMIIGYLSNLDKNDIVGRTKANILKQLPSGRVTLENVASALNLSQRSLTRRLKEAHESFKDLLVTMRQELSEKYILDKSISITEISFLLGFSDASSFSRAYKSWTGESPSTFRERL